MIGDIIGTTIGGLTNHLWQSTLFAVAAGLLTVAFRKNRAHVRYWLWLSASLKFFVPFSLLMSLGSRLQWAPAAKSFAAQAVSFTMVQIAQPFPETLPFAPSAPRATDWFLVVMLGVWACGFGAIALVRFRDWLGVRAGVQSSTRLEIPAAIEVRSFPGLLEPGVVGLLRPVLLLPAGVLERLTPPQLTAVLAHELCHVQRRDNLTAAMHMIVEAVFWFHPLVWWIGARLVEERERACDEDVLRLGSEPQVYAESILSVCKFYAESPLKCVSGVTGSDLKKRVVRIMKNHFGETLSAWKKLFLTAVGIAALALPLVVGVLRLQAQSQAAPQWQTDAGGKQAFDVASVKQNKSGPSSAAHTNVGLSAGDDYTPAGGLLSVTNFPLGVYIGFAYKLMPYQRQSLLSQLPKWATTDRFDIEARAAGGNPTKDQMRLMMQSLLADRFKLAVHSETRQLPVFALLLVKPGKTGSQLQPHSDDPPCVGTTPSGSAPKTPQQAKDSGYFPPVCGTITALDLPGLKRVSGRNLTMGEIGSFLSMVAPNTTPLDRPVLDQTGLSGRFDFKIDFAPEFNGPPPPNFQPDPTAPTFLEALREQLGLKVDSQTGPVDVLVIDHVEEPSPN
jgi:bla regulator protein BlaR1